MSSRSLGWALLTVVAMGCGRCSREPPPPTPSGLEFVSQEGKITDLKAAYTLVFLEPARLAEVYRAAEAGDPRSAQVWKALEERMWADGTETAELATTPLCLKLIDFCEPHWPGMESLSSTRPEGVRIREVIADAFAVRAVSRHMDDRVVHRSVDRLLHPDDGGVR